MFRSRIARSVAAIVLLLGLAGCNTVGEPAPDVAAAADPNTAAFPHESAEVEHADIVKYYRSDEPLRLAYEHFNRGNFGIAQRYFQDAVEKAPKDAAAWVGLAACYDRLGRFDLADRAYASAIRLKGETTEVLNNEGYSYMLRGDLVRARKKFLLAQAREPNNPTIANNLKLLDSSYRFIQRSSYDH